MYVYSGYLYTTRFIKDAQNNENMFVKHISTCMLSLNNDNKHLHAKTK